VESDEEREDEVKIAITILASLWVALAVFNYGTMNAQVAWDCTHDYPSLHETQRDNLGFIVGQSCLIPPLELITSAIISNFWQHGWDLTNRPWRLKP
jgi:hypothetical protein